MGAVIEGVDYAWDRPRIADLVKAGKKFASRYGGPGSAGKQLDAAEAKSLAAAGLWIVANAEGAANGLRGRAVGADWARQADAHFRACGMPKDRPIYLSADWDVTAGEWPSVADALRGAASEIGAARVGIYGGYRAVTWAHRDGVAAWFWQTYAWSGGRWHPACHVQQYRNGVTLGGADLDLDRALVADYGQWQPGIIPTLEDDMTDEQARQLYNLDRLNTALLAGQTTVTKLQTQDGQLVDMPLAIAAQVKALTDRPAVAVDYDLLADAIVRRVLTPPA